VPPQASGEEQLRVLRELRLVAGDRRGRQVIYSLHDDHVAVLLAEAIAHTQHLNPEAPPGEARPQHTAQPDPDS
jgi:DNA-binding transcriptional ArsR family regulator